MTVRQLVGDCRVTLPTLDAGSVQSVATSPPYYGLRDYGLPPLVWGGDAEHAHEWKTAGTTRRGTLNEGFNHRWNPAWTEGGAQVDARPLEVAHGNSCFCGAWLGSLGLEPTPDAYVEHLVEVFRHVRRVLRDDGVVWLNLGDSYNNRSVARQSSHQTGLGFNSDDLAKSWREQTADGRTRMSLTSGGLKEKDLMMMPFRVAMALQADGWYLRSVIPWLKRNSMPESVADRPATAVEYVFLLAKSARYFWDADALRVDAIYGGEQLGIVRGQKRRALAMGRMPSGNEVPGADATIPMGRNRRNSDWFFDSWQWLMLDEQDAPLALVVNPAPFTGSHFATFPPKLVEPMIKASTSEKGQCPKCGAPWVRVTAHASGDREAVHRPKHLQSAKSTLSLSGNGSDEWASRGSTVTTTGWRPSCAHGAEPVPQSVLDPFSGANTVALVADRLGRNAVGCELKSDYVDMGVARVVADAPMFADLEIA
jgi:DNA modification methylase